ncbi:hypothetical protein BAY61_29630 [Prauserella marina]|uniref:Uncharacterized protein n=1 Tax=Prauserella marina TaxID=530584 RepID=A0A222VX36_9PSEU|nr:hypothetical protein [Prauserella marina]ASR38474.1 hypothetical protein BAY61_29630 [Prauserella marina]PWV78281.1 hypothetical protein DES30_1049 [Prauserella marina]SDC82485.1 hypothetical protein SAMN05421630_1049 [Prauserella marina]
MKLVKLLGLPFALPIAMVVTGVFGGIVLNHVAYIPVLVIGSLFTPLVFTASVFARGNRGTIDADQVEKRQIKEHGERAVARVDALNPTSTTIGDNHVAELELTVSPSFGRAYRTKTKHPIHPIAAPAFQRGKVIVVKQSGKYPGVVLVDEAVPPEWAERTERPFEVGDIGASYGGTPHSNAEGRQSPLEARRPSRLLPTAVSTLVLIAAIGFPIRTEVAYLLTNPNLLDAAELEIVTGELVAANGTEFTDVTFEPNRVLATGKNHSYRYTNGNLQNDDLHGSTETEEYFDLTEVDIAAIPGLIELARERYGEGDPDRYSVRLDKGSDGGVEISVDVGEEDRLLAAADGTPALAANMFEVEGARAAFDLLAERMGDTLVYEIVVGADSVRIEAPTSRGADTGDTFGWRSGRLVTQEPMTIQPTAGDKLFDLGDVDPGVFQRMVAVLAERGAHIDKPSEEASFTIERTDEGLELTGWLSDDDRRISLVARADGSGVTVKTSAG